MFILEIIAQEPKLYRDTCIVLKSNRSRTELGRFFLRITAKVKVLLI